MSFKPTMASIITVLCLLLLVPKLNAFTIHVPTTTITTFTNPISSSTKVVPIRDVATSLLYSSSSNDGQEEKNRKKKETTWDRITGPKLFKTVTNWNGIHSVPLVPLRILTGLLMIHHGSEGGTGPANLGTPEFQGFVDYIMKPYFGIVSSLPSLEFWAAIHDYIEFFGGICFATGFLTRPASLSLLLTMMGAVYFHLSAGGSQGFPLGHVPNYSYDFEEPMLYALIFLMFWFNGAGPLSVDSVIYSAISQEDDEEQV